MIDYTLNSGNIFLNLVFTGNSSTLLCMTLMVIVFFQEIETEHGLFSREIEHELFQSIDSLYKYFNFSSNKSVIQSLSEVILDHFQTLQSKH